MKKNGVFSVPLTCLLTALVFAALVFSCKGAAPSLASESPASDSAQSLQQEAEILESSAAETAAQETGDSVSRVPSEVETLPYDGEKFPSEAGGGDKVVSKIPTEESELPDVVLPPQINTEREAALAEPDLPVLTFLPNPVIPEAPLPDLPLPALALPIEPKPLAALPPVSPSPQQTPDTPSPLAQPPQAPRQVPQPSQPPSVPREPPLPPSFLQPAEPELPLPDRQPVPAPVNPGLTGRTSPESSGEQIVFSRIVRATVGQIVEIPFRGTGWVYLGELGSRRGIAYNSRRLDLVSGVVEGQSFIFNTEAEGTYVLKFYKQDFIQDYIINDYVQVIVGEAARSPGQGFSGVPADQGRVVAEPRWPPSAGVTQSSPPAAAAAPDNTQSSAGVAQSSAPEATAETGTAPATGADSAGTAAPAAPVTGTRPRQLAVDDSIVPVAPPQAASDPNRAGASPTDLIQSGAPPAEYVRRARQEFEAGRVEAALTILDAMRQRYPSGTDEAWWLYGQLLEANSPSRDVRLAHDYYRRLVREYPQSPRAGDAQRRIAYLERYYFNIR